jgi:cobalamin biosynthesis protein CobD/CbiB
VAQRQQSRWRRPTRGQLLWAGAAAALVLVFCSYLLACVLSRRSFAMEIKPIAKLLACRFLYSQALLLRAG